MYNGIKLTEDNIMNREYFNNCQFMTEMFYPIVCSPIHSKIGEIFHNIYSSNNNDEFGIKPHISNIRCCIMKDIESKYMKYTYDELRDVEFFASSKIYKNFSREFELINPIWSIIKIVMGVMYGKNSTLEQNETNDNIIIDCILRLITCYNDKLEVSYITNRRHIRFTMKLKNTYYVSTKMGGQ